ncbi:hypothetical protein C8Q69DRAFT_517827 [Paecilomyces variotii]|uniref:Uncharacterized protein n=1 Tax=Byssochlamys spectabilis TaxID=264951 RepID=A0A443HI31_BYSSP|nr:hypothetical protein C8Q69DRAFT_517827 [Paecilomyces variotii]KAJ9230655.1 hypothetical protein DTO169E5_8351 [Paecilomyces variotii]KAJ9313419.1 hypothetical protein DTO271D3_6282 [Paecilomyces variotii]KAJ9364756.1 hypothetical protein DTO280E4_1051 [Paecilomyces variotii]RWQ91464.1 hypothetical protein C8Q69DRAFT_517827 [Paecilomyces variotii]
MASDKHPDIPFFSIPGNLAELQALLKEAGLFNKSIHDLPGKWLLSGSKVTQMQFLAFHIVFPRIATATRLVDRDLAQYGLHMFWREAQDILGRFDDFQKYLGLLVHQLSIEDISRDHPFFPSSLRILKDMQELCSPSYVSSKKGAVHRDAEHLSKRSVFGSKRRPDEEDTLANTANEEAEIETEATVNSALVVFLRELAWLVDDRNCEFVYDPLAEKASFSKDTSFTAITDGSLRRLNTGETLAILEVKKRKRRQEPNAIPMQEAAELVCWLKSSYRSTPFLDGHPLIISQDAHEIFLSFAFLDQLYLEYLQMPSVANPAWKYAAIQTYGPFKIDSAEDMNMFATLVISITLAAKALPRN